MILILLIEIKMNRKLANCKVFVDSVNMNDTE